MKTAEEFYDRIPNDDNDELTNFILGQAKYCCAAVSEVSMGDVSYEIYIFNDGSELRVGDNGYVGCIS